MVMAHQAHNIPWTILASNLCWVPAGLSGDVPTLRFGTRKQRSKELVHFFEAFARNVEEHSACERRKYADRYDPPDPDDAILDAATVDKITRTVRRWRHAYDPTGWKVPPWSCPGDGVKNCKCPVVPDRNRRVSAFLLRYQYNPCEEFWQYNANYFFSLEIIKSLLLHGEMDLIFRLCAYPQSSLRHGWDLDECGCGPSWLGFDQLLKFALAAYIVLNVIYCFPETWDPESGRSDTWDYRRSLFYQSMVQTCTQRMKYSEIPTYPHRYFFGVADQQAPSHGGPPSMVIPPSEYLPASDDIDNVRWMLRQKGLPIELAMDVMELAGYELPRRVPYDPFHPLNRHDLARYLKYCWQILVRCDMLAKALGIKLYWKCLVADCITFFCDEGDTISNMWYKWYLEGHWPEPRRIFFTFP